MLLDYPWWIIACLDTIAACLLMGRLVSLCGSLFLDHMNVVV